MGAPLDVHAIREIVEERRRKREEAQAKEAGYGNSSSNSNADELGEATQSFFLTGVEVNNDDEQEDIRVPEIDEQQQQQQQQQQQEPLPPFPSEEPPDSAPLDTIQSSPHMHDALSELQAEMEAMEIHAQEQDSEGKKVGAKQRTWYTMPGKHQFYVSQFPLPLAANMRTSLPGHDVSVRNKHANMGSNSSSYRNRDNLSAPDSMISMSQSQSFVDTNSNSNAANNTLGSSSGRGTPGSNAELTMNGKAHVSTVGMNRISDVPHIRQHSFAPHVKARSDTLEKNRLHSSIRRRTKKLPEEIGATLGVGAQPRRNSSGKNSGRGRNGSIGALGGLQQSESAPVLGRV